LYENLGRNVCLQKKAAEIVLESKLESLYEENEWDYPYNYEIEEIEDGE